MNKTEQLIIDVLREMAEIEDRPELAAASSETRLFGGKGILDSMGVVMLIAHVEEAVSSRLGKNITLADDRAMSQKTSPFRSVKTLATYIDRLIGEDA